MQEINYIKHLNAVFSQFSKDSRLNPTHISLYIALFQLWNLNRFLEEFFINRDEVMQLSKIGSKSTYHRCIKELNHWKYIVYFPSHNPYRGSKIKMFKFGTSSGQVVGYNSTQIETSSGQALVPIASRWINARVVGAHWIEVDFEDTFSVEKVIVRDDTPMSDFTLKVEVNGVWQDLQVVTGNTQKVFTGNYSDINASKIRYEFETTVAADIIRMFELEVFSTVKIQ